MSQKRRRRLAGVLVCLASVAMALALVVGYGERALVNSDQFANRATVALRSQSVRDLIARQLTDEIVLRHQADLIAARPIIQQVVSRAVGGAAFTGLFRSAVRDIHRAVLDGDQQTVTLTLADIGRVAAAALDVVRPSLADQVRNSGRIKLAIARLDAGASNAAKVADDVRVLGWLLLVLGALLVIAALVLSMDRRRTVVQLGCGAAVAGTVVVVAYGVARGVFVNHYSDPDARAAAGAVWNAFLADLRTEAFIFAGAGAVIAAAAASLLRPVELDGPLRHAWQLAVSEPSRPIWRALRGALLIAAGVAFITERQAVIELAMTLAGMYLIYVGVNGVLAVIYIPRQTPRPDRPGSQGWPRRRVVASAALVLVLVGGAVSVFLGTGGVTVAAPAPGPCDGSVALCDRPFDDVALVATHNSMAAPDPGWYSAEQDHGIPQQLRDGVRGLLIDTHYADRLANGRLRTYTGDVSQLRGQAQASGLSEQTIEAALRIRERLGHAGDGERGMYLCHTFCEIGGTSLQSFLDELHDFLAANPGAVVVVINQDYVAPRSFVDAVKRAGLGGLVYRGPVDGRWPTLQQMIDSNQRVVFFAENRAGAAPWYHLAYAGAVEETPYTFRTTAQLTDPDELAASCARNRGPDRAPLFLVNHWVTTTPIPRPSDARTVNAYDALLSRLRECQRLRHHIPNLVAVNFYRQGDVFKAVDTLNGIDGRG